MATPRDKMPASFPAKRDHNLANEASEANDPSGLPEPIRRGPGLSLGFPDGRPENFDVVLDHRLGLHSGWKGIQSFLRRLRWWSRTLFFPRSHKRPLPRPLRSMPISPSFKTPQDLLSVGLKRAFLLSGVHLLFNSLIAQHSISPA